jgi:glycine cleavage system transcriptional repressor
MTQYAVLTAVGPDRPGLVDAISKFILEAHCNIEDSRMAVLGGEFAMLILVSAEEAGVETVLGSAARAGTAAGLTIHAKRTEAPGAAAATDTVPYELNAFSMDHPGIVQQVAHYLGERRINVRALDTRVTPAPVSGQPLFALHALIDIPTSMRVRDLRTGLEEIGDQENIDVELKPAG